MPCFLFFHQFERWGRVFEVPVWQSGLSLKPRALGDRPMTKAVYHDGTKFVSHVEPDLDYILAGKFVEQRRECARCGLTQVRGEVVS